MSYVTQKQALRSLSLSYQKKAWPAPAQQAFFWYDTDYRIVLCSLHKSYFTVNVIPKDALARSVPAQPSFGMATTKIIWPVLA